MTYHRGQYHENLVQHFQTSNFFFLSKYKKQKRWDMKEFTWVNMVSTKVIKCDPKVSGSVFP